MEHENVEKPCLAGQMTETLNGCLALIVGGFCYGIFCIKIAEGGGGSPFGRERSRFDGSDTGGIQHTLELRIQVVPGQRSAKTPERHEVCRSCVIVSVENRGTWPGRGVA